MQSSSRNRRRRQTAAEPNRIDERLGGRRYQVTDARFGRAPDEDPTVSGRIVVAELAQFLPFQPRRIYWIHGMAHDEHRGFHAHRRLWQAMVAMSGGVAIELDDGGAVRGLALTECDQCLIVPPGLWRVIRSLATNSILMVIASEAYDEADYIRDYDRFRTYRTSGTVVGSE